MEEQLIKVLCKLIKFSYIYYTNITNSTLIVERFLQESELVLSPLGRQKLINTFDEIFNLNKKFMNNNIIINKKDGKTIHYMNSKLYILHNICKILQYDYDIPVNIVKYNIKDIKSIEIGE